MTAERWRQITAIFDEAVEHSPADRENFLRERCGNDGELLKQVESLLACDGETGSRLESPLKHLSEESGSDLANVTAALAERYEILGELGRGGMGIVYKARDRETGEVLALKILKPEIAADARIIGRFKNELLLAHRIVHSNVARLYDFHRAGRTVYVSMEYVEGESLRALLRRTGKLDIASGLDLARQLTAGLAEAHRQSIVHRDLKPENIMLSGAGHVKVMDFGISRSFESDATVTGSLIGTPAYMAPEQAQGKSADQRADIYSLGLILYEMFTGAPAFSAETAVSLALMQVQAQPQSPRKLIPELGAHIDRTILKCLEKDPENRFHSVDDVLRSLDGGEPDLARRPKQPLSRTWRMVAARKSAKFTLAALVLIVSVAVVFRLERSGNSFQSVQDRASIAVLPFADMSPEKNQEYFSEGLAEELLNELAITPGLRVVARTSSFQFEGKIADSRAIGRKLHVTNLLEGSVRKQGNRAKIAVQLIKAEDGFQVWSDSYDKQLTDLIAVQEEIAYAVTSNLKVRLLGGKTAPFAKTTNPEAYNNYLQGRYFRRQPNKENLEKAVVYFEQAIKLDPGYAPAWVELGESRISQANVDDVAAEVGYRKAREAVERALNLDPDLGEAHAAMGVIEMNHDWDWAAAGASLRRAQALRPGDAEVMRAAGSLAGYLGRLDEAIELYRNAMVIDPFFGSIDLGHNLHYAGRQEEARVAVEKALELAPEMVEAHLLLGRVYLAQSHPWEALAEMEKEKDPALRLFGLALAYHSLGLEKESDANLAHLIRKYQAEAPFQIAEVYAFSGETDLAFQWLERAYTTRDPGLIQLKGDPLLNGLKADPRYTGLLKKMRL